MRQNQSIKNSDCHHDHPMVGQWVSSFLYNFSSLRSETFRKVNSTNSQAVVTFLTRKEKDTVLLNSWQMFSISFPNSWQMFSIFFQGPQVPALTHSSPLPSIPFVQPDPPTSPFQPQLLSFSLTQKCSTLWKRFISKPKTCKAQGIDHFAFSIPAYLISPYAAHLHD